MNLRVREDLIRCVLLTEEWEGPYKLYLIQEILKNVDTFKENKSQNNIEDIDVGFYSEETISQDGRHTNHFGIFKKEINYKDKKPKSKTTKIATAFYEENANMIVLALMGIKK